MISRSRGRSRSREANDDEKRQARAAHGRDRRAGHRGVPGGRIFGAGGREVEGRRGGGPRAARPVARSADPVRGPDLRARAPHLRPAGGVRSAEQDRAEARRELAPGRSVLVGVQAPEGRQVPQRRAVHGGVGEVHARARHQARDQVAAGVRVRVAQPRGGEGSLHRHREDQGPVSPDPGNPRHDRDARSEGRRGPGRARVEADRHRTVPVRRVPPEPSRGADPERGLLGTEAPVQEPDVPRDQGHLHPDGVPRDWRDGRDPQSVTRGHPAHQRESGARDQARAVVARDGRAIQYAEIQAGPGRARPPGGELRGGQGGVDPLHPEGHDGAAARADHRGGRVLQSQSEALSVRSGAREKAARGGRLSRRLLDHVRSSRRPLGARQGTDRGDRRAARQGRHQDDAHGARMGNVRRGARGVPQR